MNDLRSAEDLRGQVDAEHLMYLAAFRAAVSANETIAKQREVIAELRDTLRRVGCAVFPVETR